MLLVSHKYVSSFAKCVSNHTYCLRYYTREMFFLSEYGSPLGICKGLVVMVVSMGSASCPGGPLLGDFWSRSDPQTRAILGSK